MMGNYHVRFGAGENLEIISKGYLSLKVSTLKINIFRDGTHLAYGSCTTSLSYPGR